MKKFCFRFFLIASPLFAGLAILITVQYIRERNFYNKALLLDAATKMVVLGDSHIACGIDPEILGATQSFAQVAEPVWLTLEKLERIFELSTNNIEYAIIGLPVHSMPYLFGQKERYYWNRATWLSFGSKYAPFVDEEPLLRSVDVWLWGFQGMLKRLLIAGPLNQDIGGFRPQDRCLWMLDEKESFVGPRVDMEFGEHERFEHLEERFVFVLDRMISLCRERSVTIVFVTPPCPAVYRKCVPASDIGKHKKIVEYLTNKQCVIHLNYWDMPYAEDCFADADHLNVKGVKKFSSKLKLDLIRLFSGE